MRKHHPAAVELTYSGSACRRNEMGGGERTSSVSQAPHMRLNHEHHPRRTSSTDTQLLALLVSEYLMSCRAPVAYRPAPSTTATHRRSNESSFHGALEGEIREIGQLHRRAFDRFTSRLLTMTGRYGKQLSRHTVHSYVGPGPPLPPVRPRSGRAGLARHRSHRVPGELLPIPTGHGEKPGRETIERPPIELTDLPDLPLSAPWKEDSFERRCVAVVDGAGR